MPRPRLSVASPRTLAATPPPATRTPAATDAPGRFPTLAVALASGLVLPACESPQCGASRADEIERHGRDGLRAASHGRAGEAITEIGVALGVVSHARSTWARPQGAAQSIDTAPPPIVTPVPPPVPPTPPEPIRPAGGPPPVLPHAVPPTTTPTPTTPTPTTPTTTPTTPHGGHPRIQPSGGARATTPVPRPPARGGVASVEPF